MDADRRLNFTLQISEQVVTSGTTHVQVKQAQMHHNWRKQGDQRKGTDLRITAQNTDTRPTSGPEDVYNHSAAGEVKWTIHEKRS